MNAAFNTEPLANYELARALRRRHPDWNDSTVDAERINVIRDASTKRPDILVKPPRRHPVIVETEFAPARTVEQDAMSRLGRSVLGTGAIVEGVLSVVLPKEFRTGDLAEIDTAEFCYATHSLAAGGETSRYPAPGEWLKGGVDDLADAIEHLSLSNRQLATGAEVLEAMVRNAAGRLAEHAGEASLARISDQIHQGAGEQTLRMAAAIFVSAFVFHAAIEGHDGIPPVPLSGAIDKSSLLDTWNAILRVNYWPVFSIARDMLEALPLRAVPAVMEPVTQSISKLATLGATTYHDLTGRMFQTLVSDRKFLATFYTLPESACLLAELAASRLDMDWSDAAAIRDLRVADFACGTGALLSAAQRAIYRRYRRTGGNDRDLHAPAMENVFVGLDIMPSATHLTCSMLSSAHPTLAYGRSQIHTMPYGFGEGVTHIGALDLLATESTASLFDTGESLGATEADRNTAHSVTVMDQSCDLVIMNPPFTRSTNHEAGHSEIPLPSFAGLNTSAAEQQDMARKLKRAKPLFGSGHAGLASNFMDLAHNKLREGGVLAMVLPFAFTQGKSWQAARRALHDSYSDAHIVSIATTGSTARAFSADTDMAECLLVATKRKGGRALYSNLAARPLSLLEALKTAKDAKAEAVSGNLLDPGAAGVRATEVITAARGLAQGRLKLPRRTQAVELPVAPLGRLAKRGLVHRDINGGPTDSDKTGPPRGPFTKRAIRPGEIPAYPMLWAHNAKRERTLEVRHDSCGDPHAGDEARANERWQHAASRLHCNLDFRLNSQSLAMCVTPKECLGGRAWPNVICKDAQHELPLLLWANSTPGLILFWWRGTRQQEGRAMLTITAVPDLPILDAASLSQQQLQHCADLFHDFRQREFLPANEAYCDETRKDLDRALLFGITSVLKLDPDLEENLDLLREQWCAEPSVHGGKSTRIRMSL